MSVFVLSGAFGSGKTLTMVSYQPAGYVEGQVKRIVLDMELRASTYFSSDGKDHPSLFLYGFTSLGGKHKITTQQIIRLFSAAHKKEWGEHGRPDMVGIDDVAAFQDALMDYWANKEFALALAIIYGKEKQQIFTRREWKGQEPLAISVLKSLVEAFVLDLRDQDIDLVMTSPFHNIWINFGQSGYENLPDGRTVPRMRVVGRSAKLWDVWQKITDVIWILSRKNADGSVRLAPRVEMDAFITKAALPGIPEQFDWPGWGKIWEWSANRTYVADISKLKVDMPAIDPESVAELVKIEKGAIAATLREEGITIEQIRAAMGDEYAVVLDGNNLSDALTYIREWVKANP